MDFAFTDVDTAETLTQLGLRVQGVTLAQDPANTRLQHGALAVNAHDALYQNNGVRTVGGQPQPSLDPTSPDRRTSILSPRLGDGRRR